MAVDWCDGSKESLRDAIGSFAGRMQQRKALEGMEAKITRLERGEKLSRSTVRAEGFLPDGARFFALVHRQLRCYFWTQGGTCYVSHFRYKKKQKLDSSDTQKVQANWRRVNGNSSERQP